MADRRGRWRVWGFARVYNTTQGIVALHALGLAPRYNPLPVFEDTLRQDYKTLPAYSTSFFPLAYRAYGQPIPAEADRRIRRMATGSRQEAGMEGLKCGISRHPDVRRILI